MNKSTMIAIVAGVVLVIGGGLFFANQQSQQTEEAKMAQEKAAMVTLTPEQEAMERKKAMTDKNASSRYVEYTRDALDQAADRRRVLYFYASWCPICRPADADFKKNSSKIPEDTVVIRVNYNDPDTDQEEKDLAKKYGISYQHTFVQVDSAGKELARWNGGQTDELLANIK